jgi:thiosulfate/3-mercaptopyruvate sulfurtransferase
MITGPLISAADALRHLDAAVFLDARAGPGAAEAYQSAHLQGAIHVDLETELSEPGDPAHGGRHPLPSLQRWLQRVGAWGIAPETPVLVYDASNAGMAAARAWWMLRTMGHGPLAVIDGGWKALLEAGAPSGRAAPDRVARASYPSPLQAWPIAEADTVDRARRDADWRVIDARAPERYAGELEPIDPVAGHIPGAHNLYWRSQVDAEGKLADVRELRARYESLLGDVSPEHAICYCGSGVTACHLLLAMNACGLPGARLYVGSWSEWCRTHEGAI